MGCDGRKLRGRLRCGKSPGFLVEPAKVNSEFIANLFIKDDFNRKQRVQVHIRSPEQII